ncbi:MAG: S-layer homology domain-containing protein [Bacillota bacterium]
MIPLRILIIVLLFFLLSSVGVEAADDWYADCDGHWAREYIRVLWEESVADGFRSVEWARGWGSWQLVTHYKFRPDQVATRAEFCMLLAKVHGLSPSSSSEPNFIDVGRQYTAYDGQKHAYPWIQAAAEHGFIYGDGVRFWPDSPISREQVVVMLIRSLSLASQADAMSKTEVNALLSLFSDGKNVSPFARNSMALAVKLGIVKGYPDRTIRPGDDVRRSECAALVARSCLIRVNCPEIFYPDGDGVQDLAEITVTLLKNRNILRWHAMITTFKGESIKQYRGAGQQSQHTLYWDGTSDDGEQMEPGHYWVIAEVEDRAGNVFRSVPVTIQLDRRGLWATTIPRYTHPGEYFTIRAETQGRASSVSAMLGSSLIRLSPIFESHVSKNTWTARAISPDEHGPLLLLIIADYTGVTRVRQVIHFVASPLQGMTEPNTCTEPGNFPLFVLID